MSNLSRAIFKFLIASLLLSVSIFSFESLSSACFLSTSDNSRLVMLLFNPFGRMWVMGRPLNPSCPLRFWIIFSLSLKAFRRFSNSLSAISFGTDRMDDPRLMPPMLPFFFRLGVLESDTSILAIWNLKGTTLKNGLSFARSSKTRTRKLIVICPKIKKYLAK